MVFEFNPNFLVFDIQYKYIKLNFQREFIMAVKYLDNAGTQYLVNKIKAIDGKIPTDSQITTMITTALNTYKEGIVTIVESLPQTGEEGKLYLMVDPSDSDVYIVYTWEENAFKRMGAKTFTLTVDSALSSSSTNPVQNKVVKAALDAKLNSSDLVAITTSEIDAMFTDS